MLGCSQAKAVQAVAAHMGPGFHAQQVMHHWRIMQPGRRTGKWDAEEDDMLKKVQLCSVQAA